MLQSEPFVSSMPANESSMEPICGNMALADRSPNTPKRRFDEMAPVQTTELAEAPKDALTPVQTLDISPSSGASSVQHNSTPHNGLSRQASPAPSTTSTSLTSISATPPPPNYGLDGTAPSTAQGSGQPPPKRRKLTLVEKEQRRIEKEQRDREKAEAKAKKDEETRQKKEVQEEKRRAKELEQSRKEEEKARKERAQSRINAFFAKPQTPAKSGNGPGLAASPSSAPRSDYRKTFLPFAVPANTTMAPVPVHTWDEAATRHIESSILEETSEGSSTEDLKIELQKALDLDLRHRTRRRRAMQTVKDVIRKLTGAQASPVDLTIREPKSDPITLLKQIPMRYLEFAEDIRPAYMGTFSKLQSTRMPRNPLLKERPDTDYEYDSEAEWEEPEEGEDLESEGESEGDSIEAADDMEDFLDDEEAEGQVSRRRATLFTDLEPISSGICFEDVRGDSFDSSGAELNFRSLRLELLLDNVSLLVDPFSDQYWPTGTQATINSATATGSSLTMPPPLPPAAESRPSTTADKPVNFLQGTKKAKTASSGPLASRLLEGEDLEAFRRAVNGSEFNKAVLTGLLKKQFPKFSKAVLTETLGAVAARQGEKESDKKWVLL